MLTCYAGLYTDESPGLKVDPVVVLVLSLVFIFSVVALHSTLSPQTPPWGDVSNVLVLTLNSSYRQDHPKVLQLNSRETTTKGGNSKRRGNDGDAFFIITRGRCTSHISDCETMLPSAMGLIRPHWKFCLLNCGL